MEEGKLRLPRTALALFIAALIAVLLMMTLGPTVAILPTPSATPVPSSMFRPILPASTSAPAPAVDTSGPDRPATSVAPAAKRPSTRPMVAVPEVTKSIPARLRASLGGFATYYCNATHPLPMRASRCMKVHPDTGGFDAYAAAGPALRVAMGGTATTSCPCPWRNRVVTVTSASGDMVRVKLADWCACGVGAIIDLYGDPFWALDAKGKVNPVVVSW